MQLVNLSALVTVPLGRFLLQASIGVQQPALYASLPSSNGLSFRTAKLLTIGGIESNPGPAQDEVTGARGENLPRGVSSNRPLVQFPSLEVSPLLPAPT